MLIIIFIVSSITETKDTILVDKTTFCGVDVYLFFKYHKKIDGSSFVNTHLIEKEYG